MATVAVCVARSWMFLSSFILSLVFQSAAGEIPWRQVLAPRQLFLFQSYKDVQIFHYSVPSQMTMASWEFRANCTQQCLPIEVSVYLQHGSYPVVNIDNGHQPPNFAAPRQMVHFLTLTPDLIPITLNVSSPPPGDWFSVSFYRPLNQLQSKEDTPTHCQVWLTSSASFHGEFSVIPLLIGYPMTQQISQVQHYRFFAPQNTWSARITVSKCAGVPYFTDVQCPLLLTAQARVLPDSNGTDPDVTSADCTALYYNRGCVLEFVPAEDDWNYIRMDILLGTAVEFEIKVETAECQEFIPEEISEDAINPSLKATGKLTKPPKKYKPSPTPLQPFSDTSLPRDTRAISPTEACWPQLPLVRQKLPGNFAFQYSRPSGPGSDEFSPLLNISTQGPTLAMFRIMPLVDIGGTLALELALPPSTNTSVTNISISACLHYSERPKLTSDGTCGTGYGVYVNSSAPSSCHGKLLVPFPEAGAWYLLLQPRCYFQETEDSESEIVDVQCSLNTTSMILRLESGPCILGQCGDYGRCYQYLSGGLVFSSCLCAAGWRGWGCTDDEEAHTYGQLLLALLLLTVSNVLFIPAIILAIYRRFFTEALVYLATMLFSALYHACDFEVSPFCLMRLSVLQYCDVYSTVLTLWLTLVALADLPTTLHSMCHMTGALGVALGVEYDRTGLWVVVVPIGVGLLIVAISWMCHCFHQHSCYPRKRIWLRLVPGLLLVGGDLVLFAVFQNRHNYVYVHSAQHGCLALAIICLLPDRRPPKDSEEDVMQVNWKPHGSFKFLQDNETDML